MNNEENFEKTSTPVRRDSIYQEILSSKVANVNDLSLQLGVSSMTIRRDLEYLEKKGLVERTHGGAVLSNRYTLEPLYTQKSLSHLKEKEAIAKEAATHIQNYDTVFMNSGTTTLRVFQFISARHVNVVTNNPCIPMAEVPDSVNVISTGGSFNAESFTLFGDIASYTIGQTYSTKSFLGADGFDIQHGLTTPVQAEAVINRLMIEHTRGKTIIVTDSSKIGRVSNFFVSPISAIDILITDKNISEKDYNDITQLGIKIIRV